MKTTPIVTLPEGITAKDLTYPKWSPRTRKYEGGEIDYTLGDCGHLIFHNTTAFGWCIATLHISNTKRSGLTDRTYAVRVSDGGTVRIGAGPHVTQTITVYLRKLRLAKTQKYLDLYNTGMGKANAVRDRISSRRAQGVEHRALGHSSWYWNEVPQ